MRNILPVRSYLVIITLTCLALSPFAWGQKDAGSIVGTVTDPSGAVVAKAKVVVADLDRGTKFETTTNDSGEYFAGPLRIGRYNVTVEHPGFKKAVSVPINLDVQQRIAVNVALPLGESSETVEVTGAAPLL